MEEEEDGGGVGVVCARAAHFRPEWSSPAKNITTSRALKRYYLTAYHAQSLRLQVREQSGEMERLLSIGFVLYTSLRPCSSACKLHKIR